MGQNKKNFSPVKKGMNRSTAPYLLEGVEYLFALNTNIQDGEHSIINITNEESNVLAAKFKEGYKVIGKNNDNLTKSTYFFLANNEGDSELGVIKNNQIENNDVLEDLDKPLEEIEQQPYQHYESIIEKGLNLNINYPVKSIIKNEASGKVIAFTDNLNPPRLIKLDKLDEYLIDEKEVDTEKINIFPKTNQPKINVKPVVTGGRLKRGTYQFLIAYTNSLGQEIGEYTSITNPIPIFDPNNVVMQDSEIANRTNFAIKLDITHLDTTKDYYKIVVIQNTDIEGGLSYFVEGIHPITDNTVIYSTEENKERITLEEILTPFPTVKRWEGLTQTNGHLIGNGIEEEKEINLQPVVNLMGPFLKWQTSIARETLYQSPDDNALSKGYMRNEVYPFSIRFNFNNGYKTALFPLINRPAKYFEFPENNQIYHELDNVPDSKDVQSIKEVSPTFSNTNREKIWQYYNTATSSGNLKLNNVDYTNFQEPVTKTSLVEDVGIIPKPDNYITLKLAYEPFTTLEDFLEDNFERYRDKSHPLNFIFEAFNPNNYKDQHNIPDFEDCKEPQLLGERDEIIVGEIENDEVNFIKRNIDEYRRVSTDVAKDLYVTYMDGNDKRAIRQEPEATETNKILHEVSGEFRFEKIEPPTNNDRQYALPLHRFNLDLSATKNITTLSFSNDLEVRDTKEEILTNYRSKRYSQQKINQTLPVDTGESSTNARLRAEAYFDSKVSINALWFSSEFAEDEDIKVVEIPKIAPETKIGEIYAINSHLRVTVFNDCTDVYDEDCNEHDPIMYYLVDASKGDIREFVKADMKGVSGGREGHSNQNTGGGRNPGNAGTPTPRETQREGRVRSNQPQEERQERGSRSENSTPDRTVDLYGDKFLIAVDTPIGATGTYTRSGSSKSSVHIHVASGFKGKYSIHERPLEYGSVKVMFDAIHLDKRETYRADCNFRIPQVDEFEVLPFERGDFGYVESEENYPNNEELFNSSKLKIDLKKIPEDYKQEFKDYYIKTNPDGTYELNEETNFVNKPIRHFKFPDNDIAPFMSETRLAAFSESMIFPLGIYIDDKVVNSFLDIAVDNDLLTPEQRDNITSYEIFRGDRTLEKSIVAKGLLYDNYKYTEEGDEVYFPNFPFNTLGENHLLYTNDSRNTYIQHPYDSEENNSFTFISPDNQFRKLSPATELQLEGFQLGNSKGYFSQVEDHPKWTILGDKGYRLATTLAIAETTAEVAIQIAEATIETSKNMWFTLGLSSGGNPIGTGVGTIATGVIAGFQILSNSIFKVGRYRHQWLQTFRDLGQPENFASYYTGVGHYNSLLRVPYFGNKIRAINTTKELNSGRFSFRHNDTGERVVFNNKDRERSTYIYLGKDFALEYPHEYYSYDNIELNRNLASRNIASQENACSTNQSSEIIGNVASPYVSLKNYIPSQYGTLNSIKWLPTGHLSHFENSNKTIFGGDIYLSRMTVKRKMPLFLRDAMKVPDLTPFNYGFYTNVGDARFFVNYEVSEEVNIENSIFPEFRSEYNLDCGMADKGFYLKPPSKFYLYYYGIVDFLVESDINTNFRYAKPDLRDDFYPHVGDVVEWTQETNVSIKEQNKFYYNFNYSRPSITPNYRTLPFTFSKEEYDKRYDNKNNAMWSLPDNSEVDLTEPWTTFRAYDRHNFPTSYGKLVDLKGIESGRILGRFTNQTAIFNAVDLQVDGINSNYGDGHLFSRPPRTFTETDLGYLGTQSSQMVSNEFGHFFVDTERGAVFRIDPAGEGMKEISKYSSDSITGMDKWFKKHLPFKILNPLINNYEEIDLDNPYSKVGITMGWDNKYKRVFITKKDYIPLKEMNYDNKNFFAAKDEHELITDYEADGYTYLGREDYFYKFSKNVIDIPKTTPIYVLVNVNDFTIEEAQEIKEEIKEWTNDIEGYKGEVIYIPTQSNRWLNITSELITGTFNEVYNRSPYWYNPNLTVNNLIEDSGIRVESTRRKSMKTYYLNKRIKNGTKVTLSMKAELGQDYFGIYTNGGKTYVNEFWPANEINGVFTKTFIWKGGNSDHLTIYQYGNGMSSIDWIMLTETNIIKDSDVRVNTENKSMYVYTMKRTIPNGTQVTIEMDATLGQDYFAIYANGGTTYITELWPANKEGDVFRKTFTWNGGASNNITVYQYGSGRSSIRNIELTTNTLEGYHPYSNESFNTYTGQKIGTEGIIVNFTNSSYYLENKEPTNEFISDYKQFINNFNKVDYLRNLIITKDSATTKHFNNILNNKGQYKDVPISGTNPQRFIEPLRTYGYSYMPDFNLDTQRFLNTLLGDEFKEEIILIKGDVIDVTDTEFFKDVSFTIAYSVETESWLSFYSFQPNYYISHNTYFQTGIEDSLWSHNISDKSYGVFYGEKQPWTIEYPIKNEYMPKRLQNITFWTEAKRFNEAYDKDITFNKAVIYNTYGNSGQLNLVPQKTLRQISKYPINRGTSQDILINYQDFKWTLNNIYDRTLNDGYKKQWIYDENEINKEINSDLVQFGGKKILSYLRGEYFIVRLTYDNSTEHNIIFKWGSNTEEVYQ